jgi:secondary thiamine-phosphate synthase enzyme
MQQAGSFAVSTSRFMEFVDITRLAQQAVDASQITEGICCLFNPHTTAGLTINEGCDPAVKDDLLGVFEQIIPRNYPYKHAEGNSPSHMMATLTGSSVTVFITKGRLQLGTWQRIFFCEFDGPRSRKINWKILA